jgi:hypothetical protein
MAALVHAVWGIGQELSIRSTKVKSQIRPDGHFKFLHLWPLQNPPLDGLEMM